MKSVIAILIFFISFCSSAQLAPPKQKINLNLPPVPSSNQSNVPIGPIMMLGGASFIAAGLLTPPTMVGGSTTQKKPFLQQMHRVLPVATGSIFLVVGAGFSLGGR